jgi:hypothetical protein
MLSRKSENRDGKEDNLEKELITISRLTGEGDRPKWHD